MITVFGSINVDMVMRVDALPRPGETVLCPDYVLVPGGKGANQALAAARAGAVVAMVGRVGEDPFANTALSRLRQKNVDLSGVSVSDRPTGCATVWVNRAGENAIIVASGANLDVSSDQLTDRRLEAGDWLVLQMEIQPAENWAAVEHARSRGAKVILSVAPAAPVPQTVLTSIDILLVNEIEGRMVAATLGLPANDPAAIVTALSNRFGVSCLMTLGSTGVIAASPDDAFRVPALSITPVDTTAAGDAFAGILAAALDAGQPMELAARRASAGAGLACKSVGAQTSLPAAAAIDNALKKLPPNKPLHPSS